jgi:hypothetical protein
LRPTPALRKGQRPKRYTQARKDIIATFKALRYTDKQIAEALGMREHQVSRCWSRMRKKRERATDV